MRRAKFCFAFAGDTCLAQRFYNAIANGCIPVLSCAARAAFARHIPYGSMTIHVSDRQNMSQIMATLRGVPRDRVRAMQKLLRHFAPSLSYERDAPSLVLEEVSLALARD